MAYKKAADGITKKGKTKGKNLGDTGPNKSVGGDVAKGGKATTVKSIDMKKMGRNLARAKNQGGK
jgi:hypothetical protein